MNIENHNVIHKKKKEKVGNVCVFHTKQKFDVSQLLSANKKSLCNFQIWPHKRSEIDKLRKCWSLCPWWTINVYVHLKRQSSEKEYYSVWTINLDNKEKLTYIGFIELVVKLYPYCITDKDCTFWVNTGIT